MFDVYSTRREISSDGVRVVVTDHGPETGDTVLLIHGWPDSAKLWRHQIPALTGAGYRVLAPDLPGFGASEMPVAVEGYRLSTLSRHILSVLDDAGAEVAHVIGHDWGAALGWYLGLTAPERLLSLTAISVGHPLAFDGAGMRQLSRSWYMLLFQFQGVAERWLSDDDWANFRSFSQGHPEAEAWIRDLSRPGGLTASLGIYRANMGPERLVAPERQLPRVSVPVMGVWSTNDFALTEQQMTESAEYVSGEFRYERIDEASHWVPLDAPDRLNELLLDWLAARQQ